MYNIVALIPARGGSKGIKMKNIKLFRDKPLIYWSIKQALDCKYINDVILTTDNKEIAKIGKNCGASVPFLRPTNISQDLSTDYEFVEHYLNFLKNNNKKIPDIIIQLRPTYPTRKLNILNECIELFINNYSNYDSLRTVIPFEKSPYKMYRINNNTLEPLFKKVDNINEPYNRCRQELPKTYIHNGYIDIFKSSIIYDKKSITGDKIFPYVMNNDEYHDIDTLKDWEKAENVKN